MLEQTLRRLRPCKAVKKVGMFFAAFALTVVFICASFTDARGEIADAATATVDTDTVETARTNAEVQTMGTEYAAGATSAEQTEIAAYAPARNISAEQAATADYGKDEPAVPIDALAKPVPIKLSTAAETETFGTGQNRGLSEFVYSDKIPLSYELQEYTFQKCIERGLEYELVLAVMWRESRFQPEAINLNSNGTFDSGLMQINDINKNWLYEKYGIDDLMDPYQNIDAGTAILGELYEKYGEHGAMLAYQYGETGMVRKVNQGETTSKSVEAAYRQREYYRRLV